MPDSAIPALRPELQAGLRALDLDASLAEPLLDYLALLQRWNRAYNLTAVRDPQAMLSRHLFDSLAMHALLADCVAPGEAIADLGSGAGLPGIPLALALPQRRFTLVESNGKKARFLREALRSLPLGNARVAECRIEALAETLAETAKESGTYAAITARALATLAQLIELGGHLLAPGGRLLAMKGARPDAEIAALPAGWQLQVVHPLVVPGLDAERHLIVVGRAC